MRERSDTLSFGDWVRHVFDHPVTNPAWHWDIEADTPEPPAPKIVEYLKRLFENPEPVLAAYSDAQLNQGFWFLVDSSCSNHMFALIEPDVPWNERQEC